MPTPKQSGACTTSVMTPIFASIHKPFCHLSWLDEVGGSCFCPRHGQKLCARHARPALRRQQESEAEVVLKVHGRQPESLSQRDMQLKVEMPCRSSCDDVPKHPRKDAKAPKCPATVNLACPNDGTSCTSSRWQLASGPCAERTRGSGGQGLQHVKGGLGLGGFRAGPVGSSEDVAQSPTYLRNVNVVAVSS